MNNKNLVLDCPGGGGGALNPIWPMDYIDRESFLSKLTKSLFIVEPASQTII